MSAMQQYERRSPPYDLWHHPDQDYREALEQYLTFMFHQGFSHAVIADRLGITRNAVIGKVHRLGLVPPKNKITMHDVDRSVRRKRERTPPMLPPEPPKPAEPNAHAHYRPVWQLVNESCRFPMWRRDTPVIERLYCGVPEADINSNRPFCVKHSKLCYRADRR
jgi:GcrA cell cycle regulator